MLPQILFRSTVCVLHCLCESVLRTYFNVTGVVRSRFRPGSLVDMVNLSHSSILSSISLEKESYRIWSYFLSSCLSALPLGAMHTLLSILPIGWDLLWPRVLWVGCVLWCSKSWPAHIITTFQALMKTAHLLSGMKKTANKLYFSIWLPSEDRSVCASAQPDQSSLFAWRSFKSLAPITRQAILGGEWSEAAQASAWA